MAKEVYEDDTGIGNHGGMFGMGALTTVSETGAEMNAGAVIQNPQDLYVRSELMWDSSIAENGLLKLGKITDFQCHQIEHQLGAYTDCSHGQGLAVIHPILYKHIYKNGLDKFVRFAKEV